MLKWYTAVAKVMNRRDLKASKKRVFLMQGVNFIDIETQVNAMAEDHMKEDWKLEDVVIIKRESYDHVYEQPDEEEWYKVKWRAQLADGKYGHLYVSIVSASSTSDAEDFLKEMEGEQKDIQILKVEHVTIDYVVFAPESEAAE